jgi:hypothetical protein
LTDLKEMCAVQVHHDLGPIVLRVVWQPALGTASGSVFSHWSGERI